jgi:hypothetical protein
MLELYARVQEEIATDMNAEPSIKTDRNKVPKEARERQSSSSIIVSSIAGGARLS